MHRLPDGSLRIFSRKLDLMTSKYPDVEAAVTRACASATLPFIIDAEIVPIAGPPPGPGADPGTAGGEGPALATFQTLSTRKRKDVTEANAAAKGTAVQLILFDLLALGATSLISRPLRERRAALHRLFEPVRDAVAFVKNTDVRLPVAAAVPRDRDQGDGDAAAAAAPGPDAEVQMEGALRAAVAAGCEGLMVKLLDGPASAYDPSTRRSGAWLKLKKDYVDGMGDSLDLIPIGGWRGQGRKQRWISPWLMATYDPIEGTLGSVCRVMSGFTDAVYRENTIKYMGREFSVGGDEGAEAEGAALAYPDDLFPMVCHSPIPAHQVQSVPRSVGQLPVLSVMQTLPRAGPRVTTKKSDTVADASRQPDRNQRVIRSHAKGIHAACTAQCTHMDVRGNVLRWS